MGFFLFCFRENNRPVPRENLKCLRMTDFCTSVCLYVVCVPEICEKERYVCVLVCVRVLVFSFLCLKVLLKSGKKLIGL